MRNGREAVPKTTTAIPEPARPMVIADVVPATIVPGHEKLLGAGKHDIVRLQNVILLTDHKDTWACEIAPYIISLIMDDRCDPNRETHSLQIFSSYLPLE